MMTDIHFMKLALTQAQLALDANEVPVGAVLVKDGEVIAQAHNRPISNCDPCAHAEILALRLGAQKLNNYRLDDCSLFVTLEPCAMCSGAILHARLKRVVFGAAESQTGCAGSIVNLFAESRLNHHTELQGSVLSSESLELMRLFFQKRRLEQQQLEKMRHILREDALRTPDSRFENLPDFPWTARYINDLPILQGFRIHYLDEKLSYLSSQNNLNNQDNQNNEVENNNENTKNKNDIKKIKPIFTWLCVSGAPVWAYHHRQMMAAWLNLGHRVVVLDLPGSGRSDKPKKALSESLTAEFQRQLLWEFVDYLDLDNIILTLHGYTAHLALELAFIPKDLNLDEKDSNQHDNIININANKNTLINDPNKKTNKENKQNIESTIKKINPNHQAELTAHLNHDLNISNEDDLINDVKKSNSKRFKAIFLINPATPKTHASSNNKILKRVNQIQHQKNQNQITETTPSLQELNPEEQAAYQAPFPDAGHCAALRVVPELLSLEELNRLNHESTLKTWIVDSVDLNAELAKKAEAHFSLV